MSLIENVPLTLSYTIILGIITIQHTSELICKCVFSNMLHKVKFVPAIPILHRELCGLILSAFYDNKQSTHGVK